MAFTPRSSVSGAKRFQATLEIASGYPAGLCCARENSGLRKIRNPEVEFGRRLSERLMVDHAVSPIHDPGVRVNLGNRGSK